MSFDDIVTGHIEWIARLALTYSRNREDAEDLAQETLCRILANRLKYDPRYDFKPWAVTIMANIYKTRYARGLKAVFLPIDEDMPHISHYRADGRAAVNSILDTVNRIAKRVIGIECVMLYAQGLDYAEIAEAVGIGVGTVKSRIHQGRKALRKALGL